MPVYTPFRTALTALASLSVVGVTHNYDIDATPERLGRAGLPALILTPTVEESRRRQGSEFQLATPTGSSAIAQYHVTHLLLVAPLGVGKGVRDSVPKVVDLVDAYANAIRASPTLGGSLLVPTVYTVSIASIAYASVTYFGARFWHTLTIQV